MVEIMNTIIKIGGTTAHQTRFTDERMISHYIEPEDGISCILAELDGQIVGFQSLVWPSENDSKFPDGWAIIATFVKPGLTGAGLGKALFLDTEMVAANSGVAAIDATIRSDNTGGLRYYSKLGFQEYRVEPGAPLTDGTPVDRISKRFDLG